MTDMLDRAARALAQEIGEPIVSHATVRKDWASMTDLEHRALRFGARDALLAALDPEDEALIERVARAMCVELGLHADDWSEDAAGERIHVWQKEAGTAREAIAAMRSYAAQGGNAT